MSTSDNSDEDSDYIPPAVDSGPSDVDEPGAKRPRRESSVKFSADEEDVKNKQRAELWAEFQALPQPINQHEQHPRKLVKVEKRHRYAGEDVLEIVEVPEDSEDAKKYPISNSSTKNIADNMTASAFSEAQLATSSTTATTNNKPKRPGPRKPKTMLPSLPSAATRGTTKLTTIDKSAIDWRTHLSSNQDLDLKDQLEANRRGGGYLGKLEFLQRVGDRKDELLDANKSSKRRR